MAVTIDITTKSKMIGISNDGTNFQWVNKLDLTVVPIFVANPNYPHNYRYPTQTIINLMSAKGKVMMEFEAQDVTARATWCTGLQSGLTAAANDLATWIST